MRKQVSFKKVENKILSKWILVMIFLPWKDYVWPSEIQILNFKLKLASTNISPIKLYNSDDFAELHFSKCVKCYD